jgi:hypothetical protein
MTHVSGRNEMADTPNKAVPDVSTVSRLQQAYQRTFEAMSGLTPADLTPINLDVPSVYTLGSGALLKIRSYRERILALPDIWRSLVEKIDDYLLALGHAQALYIAASTPVASIPELYAQLLKQREMLLADSTALATRGLIPGDKLKELRGPISHSDTAFDVLALASILRTNASSIAGKSALTLSDLERAETLADQLLAALGERVVSEEQASSAVLNRQRAFTLFVRAYDEVRRGLVYLRWHDGDADEIAPSLYSSRVGRRRRPEPEPDETEVEGPVSPPPPPVPPVNGTTNAGAPVGHPDSSPFSS